MALTTDDFRRISDRALQRVQRVRQTVADRVTLPDTERRDLEEYQVMTPVEHGRVMQQVGQDKYREYIDEMERLKIKYQPRGG